VRKTNRAAFFVVFSRPRDDSVGQPVAAVAEAPAPAATLLMPLRLRIDKVR